MSLRKYPGLKQTGIPWFPAAPDSWRVLPLFACAAEKYQSNLGSVNANLLSLSYGNIVRKDINSNDGLLPESFETYQVVDPGDIILRLTDMQNDQRSLRSGIVRERGIITSAYLNLQPTALESEYLAYQIRAIDTCKVMYSMGGGLRQSIKYSDLKQLPLIAPPLQEQKLIARFLDRETAKIDALITEQERLIALLQEKRQAVISHAVTKGLDPNVPMKDSGVQWMGRIPAHWSVTSTRRLASAILTGRTPSTGAPAECDAGSTIPWYTPGDFTGSLMLDQSVRCISEATLEANEVPSFPAGSVLLVAIGATLGKLAVARRTCSANQQVNAIVPASGTNGRYVAFALDAQKEQIVAQAAASTLPILNQEKTASLLVALPPALEQDAIVALLDEQLTAHEAVLQGCERSINLLFERRTALITAAVTGQIDVRGLVETAA
ncbi:MAG TPA: restriction endonuclease subunit S [Gemmatimonadaceae bacterium]|nr:restriction endonuclease subunit S [Gemmatimonadaceae bacterium]HRQ77526.1 restriction endonuclease subunit S [Gemmatimonadaceae bacterium]